MFYNGGRDLASSLLENYTASILRCFRQRVLSRVAKPVSDGWAAAETVNGALGGRSERSGC
jgi:hypothetical protein